MPILAEPEFDLSKPGRPASVIMERHYRPDEFRSFGTDEITPDSETVAARSQNESNEKAACSSPDSGRLLGPRFCGVRGDWAPRIAPLSDVMGSVAVVLCGCPLRYRIGSPLAGRHKSIIKCCPLISSHLSTTRQSPHCFGNEVTVPVSVVSRPS